MSYFHFIHRAFLYKRGKSPGLFPLKYRVCSSAVVEFLHSLVHGNQVFHRSLGNHIVDGRKDIAAALGQNVQPLLDLLTNLLRSAEGQGLLGIHAAAPEHQLVAVLLLEHMGVHASGRQLHRVEDVHTHFHEVVQIVHDAAAAVVEGLPGGILVYPIVDSLVVGLVRSGYQSRYR